MFEFCVLQGELQKRGLHHNGGNLESQGQFVDHNLGKE